MSLPEEVAIRLVGLKKSFGSLVVLDGIDLDIRKGRTTALVGPSGSGKSVLLKHIVGLIQPDEGQVLVGDVDMATASGPKKREVRKRFGMLFQGGALFEDLSAGENIAFPLRFHTKLNAAQRKALAEEKLALVDLPGLYDRPTPALSGGQRKRVALARAIVLEPDVVLFDEPNSGLDPITSTTIDQLIQKMQAHLGITFLIITHDIVQALSVSHDLAMLWEGKLIAQGPTSEVACSEHPIVSRFLARR